MRINKIIIFSFAFIISGCSIFGGGFSTKNPLKMQQELSIDARYLLDDAFNLAPSKLKPALVDHHFHLIGNGQTINKVCPSIDLSDVPKNASLKTWLNKKRFSLLSPISKVKTSVLMNTVKVKNKNNADVESVKRVLELVEGLVKGENGYNFRVHLLAIDGYYEKPSHEGFYLKTGYSKFVESKTDLVIPNWYTIKLAECLNNKFKHSNPFVPVISINPYREDALIRLEELKDKARYIKWVAPSQGFDPSNPLIKPFYQKVKEFGMVIMSHTGDEHAFNVMDESTREFGNPLLMRNALDMGIPVILSHAGGDDVKNFAGQRLTSIGDQSHAKKHRHGLDLSHEYRNHWNFMKMILDEKNKEDWCLFGDISALTLGKNFQHFKALMGAQKDQLQYRLLYGSDYPLAASRFLFPLRGLIEQGYLHPSLEASLEELFSYNPLAFDIAVKRNLHHPDSDDWLTNLPKETFMSLEENIRREKTATNFTGVKRQACFDWYKDAVGNIE